MATLKSYRLRIETEDPLYHGQKKLKVRGRDLVHLSSAVFHLMELEVLDLSPEREACLDYKLTSVPPGIGRLVNLTTLMLDTNDLVELPAEIALLQSLERVALSNNRLSSLPPEFKNLKHLRSVHMANNQFQEFPPQLLNIQTLEFLDMSDNKLKVLPVQISQLKNLQSLLLFINELTKLPDSLCSMTELRCLWVGNNKLRALPRNFGQLVNLDWGHRYTSTILEGNPLIHPPLEICRMGPQAIDRYMKSLASDRGGGKSESEGGGEKRDRTRSKGSREDGVVRENGT